MAVYRTDVIAELLSGLDRKEAISDGSRSFGLGRDEAALSVIHETRQKLLAKREELIAAGRQFELQPLNPDGSWADNVLEA